MMADASPTPLDAVGRTTWTVRILGVALVLGLLLSFQQSIGIQRAGRNVPFERVLLDIMPYWLLWVAAAPVVASTARFVSSATGFTPWMKVTIHITVAVALMLLHSAGLYASQLTFGLTDLHVPIWKGALAVSQWRLPSNLLVYGTLLGVFFTSEATRRTAAAMRHAHDRELLAARLSEQLATARLHALRMQLNPHFLFNALNTVAMLVRRGDGQNAVRVLAGSSDLLRYCLSDTASSDVSLDEELAFIRKYLSIEQARFGDALRVTWDVATDTGDARVPSLILHPIVENAVRHGAALASQPGLVGIKTARRGDRLVIEITDNGPGVGDDSPGDSGGAGVGIRNTIERLSHLHGDDFEFELRSESVGAVATIALPFSTERFGAGRG